MTEIKVIGKGSGSEYKSEYKSGSENGSVASGLLGSDLIPSYTVVTPFETKIKKVDQKEWDSIDQEDLVDHSGYKFDSCCSQYKFLFSLHDFSGIKDKDGNTCLALIEIIKEPKVEEIMYDYSRKEIPTKWIRGIHHIKDCVPLKDIFATCKRSDK